MQNSGTNRTTYPRSGINELIDLADRSATDPKVARETYQFLLALVPAKGQGGQ